MFQKTPFSSPREGEIARRIFSACREMGGTPLAVFSDAGTGEALTVRPRRWKPAQSAPRRRAEKVSSHPTKLRDIARRAGCDALHPGYGFRGENPQTRQACAAKQHHPHYRPVLTKGMERMGEKTARAQSPPAWSAMSREQRTQSTVSGDGGTSQRAWLDRNTESSVRRRRKGMRIGSAETEWLRRRDASSEA